jgi:hypothetical protein
LGEQKLGNAEVAFNYLKLVTKVYFKIGIAHIQGRAKRVLLDWKGF